MARENGAEPRKTIKGLGSLEAQLMETLWTAASNLSVQEVCDRLGPDHNYKTVMTVLNRLVDKELLLRALDGRAYKYRPRQTREEFLVAVADELVQGYLTSYGPDAAKHLSTAVGVASPGQQPAPAAPASAPTTKAYKVPGLASRTNGHTPVVDELPLPRISPLWVLMGVAVVLQVVILIRSRR
ncbi:MAG: BlaI/MecI/CopY family transcriptional regulator [Dehalococcoidia bacterium]